MKKALLVMIAAVLITACQSAQNPNANLNSNATSNPNGSEVTDEEECTTLADYFLREIVINSGPRLPSINDVHLNLTAGPKRVNWCVRNNSGERVNVVIAHLHEIASPHRAHPFGNKLPSQNAFVTLTINDKRVKNVITEDAQMDGTYEYDVLLFDKKGNPADFVDPQVIISDGRRMDRSANSNTLVRNANTAITSNKNKK